MDAATAARLGGEEMGATYKDEETDRTYHLYPIWKYEDKQNPLRRDVTAYRLITVSRENGEEQVECENIPYYEISKTTNEFPSLWKPNMLVSCELSYFDLVRSLQPSQFLLRVHHPFLAARVQYNSHETKYQESAHGVIELTWKQEQKRDSATMIEILTAETYGVCQEIVGVILLQFTDDKQIGFPYRMELLITHGDEFLVKPCRV